MKVGGASSVPVSTDRLPTRIKLESLDSDPQGDRRNTPVQLQSSFRQGNKISERSETSGVTRQGSQYVPRTSLLSQRLRDSATPVGAESPFRLTDAHRSILSYTDSDSSAESDRQEIPHSVKLDLGIEMSSDSDTEDVVSTRYVYAPQTRPEDFPREILPTTAPTFFPAGQHAICT